MSAFEALESGSRLDALRVLQSRLAAAIELAEPRELAPLVRQMTIVLAELEEIAPPEKKGSPLDELASRRGSVGPSQSRSARR